MPVIWHLKVKEMLLKLYELIGNLIFLLLDILFTFNLKGHFKLKCV